jgi:hypothetical protein
MVQTAYVEKKKASLLNIRRKNLFLLQYLLCQNIVTGYITYNIAIKRMKHCTKFVFGVTAASGPGLTHSRGF